MSDALQTGWKTGWRIAAAALIWSASAARAESDPAIPPPELNDASAPLDAELRLALPPPDPEDVPEELADKLTLAEPRGGRLRSQTTLMFGVGVIAVGVLYFMPASITGWDQDYGVSDLPSRWWDNVTSGPRWDDDDVFFNYVTHPYCGGVYYVMARKSGYGPRDSFVYSALMSTFFWEYGIEAFAEVPSIQDLITTPVGGWLYGEWAYHREKAIIANGNRLFGSRVLGYVARFLIDPVDRIGSGINHMVGRDWIYTGDISIRPLAFVTPDEHAGEDDAKVTLRLAVQF